MHYVSGFAFSRGLHGVHLIKKLRGPAHVVGRWCPIGGGVERGETPEDAMTREWCEEVDTRWPTAGEYPYGVGCVPAPPWPTPWTHFAGLRCRSGDYLDLYYAELPLDAECSSRIDEEVDWFELKELRCERHRFVDNTAWLVELALAGHLRADRGEPHLTLLASEVAL